MATLISAVVCAEDKVLMTIDGEPVMASEFQYIYEKNNNDAQTEPMTLDEYLTLFTNFRLKVHEAEMQKLDTAESFKKELAGYRAQATAKYLVDKEAEDSLIRMTYDRICRDRRAAHIVVRCPKGSSPEEEAIALAKINDIRERVTIGKEIKKGKGKKAKLVRVPEDFKTVAMEVSEDPMVKENGGELGWITVFRYVYPFEEAVYNTPVGAVSDVFRSGFGYHIALVEEERPHEEVRAQHIMKMAQESDPERVAAAKEQIDAIYARIMAGEDFAELAKTESEDRGSASRGGDLGWFGKGAMVQPFEEAVFALNDSGEVSAPVLSRYGWHIIRLEGKRMAQPYEEMKAEIEKKMQRDERAKEAEKSFLRKTRAEYNLPATMTDKQVMDYADQHLEEKYEEFRMLVKEYHDGILLFDVSLKEVWDKAPQDKEGLTKFFKKNKKKYTWENPRYKGYVLSCKNEQVAKAAKMIVKTFPHDSVESVINTRLNLDSTTYVKVSYGMWEKGMNPAVDKFGFKDKKSEFTPSEDLPVVVCLGKVLKAPEEWADERTKVITDYQDYLEAEWLKVLRQKYPVVINEDVLAELKK